MKVFKIILISGVLFSTAEVLANRTATRGEIQSWCAGSSSLNVVTMRDRNTGRTLSRSEVCAHYGFGASPASVDVPNQATGRAPEAAQVADTSPRGSSVTDIFTPAQSEARAAVNPTPAGATPQGGAVNGSQVCNDGALTAAIPNGRNRAPGFPTSQQGYREYAVGEILNGNIPSHLRDLVPVQMGNSSSTCMGRSGPVTFCAMPEPIAVGGSNNYAYANLRINDAVQVGRELGFILPTSHMIDAIHANAPVRVRSLTRPWFCNTGGDCTAGQPHRFQTQSTDVRNLVHGSGNYRPGALVSGAYKDYALSHRLTPSGSGYSNMSLYGWNGIQGSRDRIQHDSSHLDYSQVPRFVSQWVAVGGQWEPMSAVLADQGCARILNGGTQIGGNITGVFTNPSLRAPGGAPRGGNGTGVQASN